MIKNFKLFESIENDNINDDFIHACQIHDMKQVKELIKKGADLNTTMPWVRHKNIYWYEVIGKPGLDYGWDLFDYILKYRPEEVHWVVNILKKIEGGDWIPALKKRHPDLFDVYDLGLM